MSVIPHSIGLSIGSAHRFNREHVAQMARWHEWLRFPWHSDHLSFHLTELGHTEVNGGVMLPLPPDYETLDLLVSHVVEVQQRIEAPFLLENNVSYVRLIEEDLEEAEFLNALCHRSGCGLLLDLHNVYTNSRNHHHDASALLEQLDLSRVIELHVAGGMEYEEFYLDAHSGPTPQPVWELLEWTLPRCPNVGGVVLSSSARGFLRWVRSACVKISNVCESSGLGISRSEIDPHCESTRLPISTESPHAQPRLS